MKTEEEKRESARLAAKKYYAANKEKVRADSKAWRLANKEKAADYQREYVAKNAEKLAVRAKEYGENYRESKKDGFFSVYLLPEENYVGMTTCFHRRLHSHKSENKRNTEGAYILSKHETKKEAVEVEASYHAKGYLGRNPNFK